MDNNDPYTKKKNSSVHTLSFWLKDKPLPCVSFSGLVQAWPRLESEPVWSNSVLMKSSKAYFMNRLDDTHWGLDCLSHRFILYWIIDWFAMVWHVLSQESEGLSEWFQMNKRHTVDRIKSTSNERELRVWEEIRIITNNSATKSCWRVNPLHFCLIKTSSNSTQSGGINQTWLETPSIFREYILNR